MTQGPTQDPTQEPRRVLLIDDHDLIRQGLARAFERQEDFVVAGQAASVAEGLRQFGALKPDVVITDVRLPDGTGFDLVREIRKQGHDLGIVVLTMYAGDEQLFAALEAGASAFVAKDAPADEVVAAARHAMVSPRSFAAADLAGAMRRRMTPAGPQLTARESEVLSLLAQGFSVAAIARSMFVSESTAKTHISKIYEKLGASNRADAIMKAVRSGLLADDLQQ
jgi:DNA-binding NarL/FixJ family response regulator